MVFFSLTVRAIFAVLFLVGFYAFGLALGLVLIGAGIGLLVQGVKAGSLPVPIVVGMVTIGGAILAGLVPRRDRFEPPGPEIDKAQHPKLFAVIEDIARRMGQPMPDHVYTMPAVNAFACHQGGFIGLGGKRIMGVGMGLLATSNVSQLRATIAHELGHFAGGETRLTGLIYVTRGAMIRTLENLGNNSFSLPFAGIWKVYLWLTQAISRRQELIADEWSVRIAGRTALITSLQQGELHSAAFKLFVRSEVAPLLQRGVAPDNLFEGYRRFAMSKHWSDIELSRSAEVF
jgi:heat shock protein HtpX